MTRRTRKDGSLVDVEVRAAPLLVNGQIVGTFGIYHDVTELHRQKRFYEALVDVSPAAIVAIDPQDRVTLWNPAAGRLFGYTAEEAIGRSILDLVARREELRAEAHGYTQALKAAEPIHAVTRRTRKDGSLVDVEVLGVPVVIGGKHVGDYVLYHDISELQRQKQYYESVLELSPTAIVTVDEGFHVTSWNPAAQQLFGYTPEEAVGR